MRDTALDALETYFPDEIVWENYRGKELAAILKKDSRYWSKLYVAKFKGGAKRAFSYYENSQIAYEFTLDLEESNIDTAGVKLTRAFISTRSDILDFGGISSRQRSTKRTFNIVDTFAELALRVPETYCKKPSSVNIVYPVIGKLPIYDLVFSCVQTNDFHNLGGPGPELRTIFGSESTPAVPQMGDTVIFTTRFTGSLGPSFSPPAIAGIGFVPTSGTFKTENFREDKHQVLIVVSTSPDAAKIRPLNARVAPPLPYSQSIAGVLQISGLPPAVNGKLTEDRYRYGVLTLQNQRQKNVDDAIVRIGDSLSRISP